MTTIHYYASEAPSECADEQPNELALTHSQLTKEAVRELISRHATRHSTYELIAPLSILFRSESWSTQTDEWVLLPKPDRDNDVSPVATGELIFHAFPPEDAICVVIHARRALAYDVICEVGH